jgi:hypothetical protein
VGVGLQQRRRDAQGAGGQDQGPAAAASRAQHPVGAPAAEDAEARGRGGEVARDRAGEAQARAAR